MGKRENKKGNVAVGLYGFFLVLMVFSSVYFFLSYGMHYLLYDYAIDIVVNDVASNILDFNGTAMNNINTLASDYILSASYYDVLFLVLLVTAFAQSTIASLKARESGFLSFFGLATIGNLILLFVLYYATQVQGWILNEVLFNVILVNVETPVLTFFYNYGTYVCLFWFLWVLGVNQINVEGIKERLPNLLPNKFGGSGLTDSEGRFEE